MGSEGKSSRRLFADLSISQFPIDDQTNSIRTRRQTATSSRGLCPSTQLLVIVSPCISLLPGPSSRHTLRQRCSSASIRSVRERAKGVFVFVWDERERACLEPGHHLFVVGLLPHEQCLSVLNIVLTRPNDSETILKSKEPLLFYVGHRRFVTAPIFSQHTQGNKHKVRLVVDRSSAGSGEKQIFSVRTILPSWSNVGGDVFCSDHLSSDVGLGIQTTCRWSRLRSLNEENQREREKDNPSDSFQVVRSWWPPDPFSPSIQIELF